MHQEEITKLFAEINPMVCFNSRVKMLNRMLTTIYDKAFKPFGLNGNQFTLLLFIGKTRITNQKKIADMLMINFSTVSRDISKLQDTGWVICDKGSDARNAQISLSDTGLSLLKRALPVWQAINNKLDQLIGATASGNLNLMIKAVKNDK
ncbi:MarR family winged helix-turn-helix transcriptional regulator [Mucilaginibacter sp. HD30]